MNVRVRTLVLIVMLLILFQKMKSWLFSFLDTSPSLPVAVAVAYTLFRMNFFLGQVKHEQLIKLLESLRLCLDLETRTCPDYKLLCDLIPLEERYTLF